MSVCIRQFVKCDSVSAAANEILFDRGQMRTGGLADKAGLSLCQFERRFSRQIGVVLSYNARIARFEAALDSLERSIPGAIPTLAALLRDWWRDSTSASIQQLVSFLPGMTDGSVRAAAIRALAAIHTNDTLPFLASLLTSADVTEQIQAVYGLSAFANACPLQMPNNTTSGTYLQCDAAGPYKTTQTTANFAFPAISAARLTPLVSIWQGWWSAHSELH